MTDDVHQGGCLCGAVRFEVAGEASSRANCHCASCQAAAGAPFVAWATFATATFSLLRGALALYHSSPGVERGFCKDCGTTLTYAHAERPDDIDVTTAALDDADRFAPDRHIWVADKVAWLSINDGLPQYDNWSTQP